MLVSKKSEINLHIPNKSVIFVITKGNNIMKKETAITLAEISKTSFGILTIMDYIFAVEHRVPAIVIPFILWIVSAIIYNKIK